MKNIENLVSTCLSGLGYECVDIEQTSNGILRIYIDKPQGISIDDCAYVSNHLNRILTVENIDYKTLEISSPGLDRVLKKVSDFSRFIDHLVDIKTHLPIDQQKKFTGRILSFDGEKLTLLSEQHNSTITIDFNNIKKARLKPKI
ncbi:MAG: ribosome maturation factor RimP [Neisseriaceae bacterium]|nr:MAG: ribosome maturation factor RimP [Neisseriaceae bacterium]